MQKRLYTEKQMRQKRFEILWIICLKERRIQFLFMYDLVRMFSDPAVAFFGGLLLGEIIMIAADIIDNLKGGDD